MIRLWGSECGVVDSLGGTDISVHRPINREAWENVFILCICVAFGPNISLLGLSFERVRQFPLCKANSISILKGALLPEQPRSAAGVHDGFGRYGATAGVNKAGAGKCFALQAARGACQSSDTSTQRRQTLLAAGGWKIEMASRGVRFEEPQSHDREPQPRNTVFI